MPNTVISTTAVNGDLSDIATALTDSLARDGQGGMTGAFRAIDGTVSLPGISFVSDPDSGIRRVTANELAVTVGGADALTINGTTATFASGINVNMTGALAVTGTQTITSTAGVPLTINNSLAGVGLSIRSTNTGAEGPAIDLYHDSASPAPADVIGAINFLGEDSAGNTETYAKFRVIITDATSGSEDAEARLQTVVAGTGTDQAIWPVPAFRANKNGTDQTNVANNTTTLLTFSTEVFDIGGYFTSNAWTPPAGRCEMIAQVFISAGVTDTTAYTLHIQKDGATIAQNVVRGSGAGGSTSLSVSIIDDANGSNAYTVALQSVEATNKTVSGSTTATYFCGHRV